MGGTSEFLRSKNISTSKVRDIYFDSSWVNSVVVLKKNNIDNKLLTRYELHSNTIEVKTETGVMVLDVKEISSYTTVDASERKHEFINGSSLLVEGSPVRNLFEVLAQGKLTLYKKYSYYISIPNYNPALAVGNPNEQVYLQNEIYFSFNNDKNIKKAPPKKKKFLEMLPDHSEELKKFITDNKLNVSKEVDIVKAVKHYNSL